MLRLVYSTNQAATAATGPIGPVPVSVRFGFSVRHRHHHHHRHWILPAAARLPCFERRSNVLPALQTKQPSINWFRVPGDIRVRETHTMPAEWEDG